MVSEADRIRQIWPISMHDLKSMFDLSDDWLRIHVPDVVSKIQIHELAEWPTCDELRSMCVGISYMDGIRILAEKKGVSIDVARIKVFQEGYKRDKRTVSVAHIADKLGVPLELAQSTVGDRLMVNMTTNDARMIAALSKKYDLPKELCVEASKVLVSELQEMRYKVQRMEETINTLKDN